MSRINDKLPKHTAPDNIWTSVKGSLNNKQILSNTVAQLPKHQAPDEAWNVIRKEIHPNRKLLPILIRVAAIIILLLGLVWLFNFDLRFGEKNQQIAQQFNKAEKNKTQGIVEKDKKDTTTAARKININPTVKKAKEVTKPTSAPVIKKAKRKTKGLNIMPMQTMRSLLASQSVQVESPPIKAGRTASQKPKVSKVKLSVSNKVIAKIPDQEQKRFQFSMFNNWNRTNENYTDTSFNKTQPMLVARINL